MSRRRVRTSTPSRRQRAWVLLEMMVAVALLGLFAALLTNFFTVERSIIRHTNESLTMAVQFDSMLDRLRRDVWSASSIETDDSQHVRITPVRGEVVVWRVDADGRVHRDVWADDTTVADASLSWQPKGVTVELAPRTAGLDLRIAAIGHESASTIALVSQIMLQGGAP